MSRKILHCADLHGNLDWYRWLRQVAPTFDLVCIAGDLLNQRSDDSLRRQSEQVSGLLGDFPAPLALCSGNHDVVSDDGTMPGTAWLHELRGPHRWVDGDRWPLLGHNFRSLGWNDPVPEAQPGEIWITHAPPERCTAGTSRRGEDYGDFDFGVDCRLHRGPRLALCGHVHEPQAWHDWVGATLAINPGCTPGAPFPNHFIVDLDRGTAEWRCFRRVRHAVSLGTRWAPVPTGRTKAHLLALLEAVLANQRLEEIFLTPSEIKLVRQRLRAPVRSTQPKENI
jgi:predicted phosphodiesterase